MFACRCRAFSTNIFKRLSHCLKGREARLQTKANSNSILKCNANNYLHNALFTQCRQCIYTITVFRPFFYVFAYQQKNYALFRPHFYNSISVVNRLLHFDKNFVNER